LIGDGADGFVILDAHIDNDLQIQHPKAEKGVYQRLYEVLGIARCIECTGNAILHRGTCRARSRRSKRHMIWEHKLSQVRLVDSPNPDDSLRCVCEHVIYLRISER
jgi:hypothetical protein